MPRHQLIEDIEALCAENRDEGWNIAYDVLAEMGLDAFTDTALETLAQRCRSEFAGAGTTGTPPALQMSLDV